MQDVETVRGLTGGCKKIDEVSYCVMVEWGEVGRMVLEG